MQNMYATYTCVNKPFASLISIITVVCNCLQYNNDVYCENLCRCRLDYGLRISLDKKVEGHMSIVTQLPDVLAQFRAFISGRSKVHDMATYIHK